MEEFQQEYYKKTSAAYDEMHCGGAQDEHNRALQHIIGFAKTIGVKSFLDVGCGSGRGVSGLSASGFNVTGIDPSQAMLDLAQKKNPAVPLILSNGEKLPFGDLSFDGVCEFGMLHHVRCPNDVVKEMLRVSKRAIFLSDSNRFGQGGLVQRLVKLVAYKTGLWSTINHIKTKGKGYIITEGDGLSYSYSVYDSFNLIRAWADSLYLIPTGPVAAETGWFSPLLTSGHVLLVAYKES